MGDPVLYICASPIGNLGDVSERLGKILREVEVVYAEDTRRASKLLHHVGSPARARSLFAGNEKARSDEVIDHLASGSSVALLTDAGTPSVSDPGAWLVSLAHASGFSVQVIPGPSAVTSALASSGFPAERFVFEGFLPRKGSARELILEELAAEARTIVLFASPKRLGEDLADLERVMGPDRQVAVARELTKLHEEVWTGILGEASEHWAEPTRGEVTVVLGPIAPPGSDVELGLRLARDLVEQGRSVSDAAREVSAGTGVPRRLLYQALLDDQRLRASKKADA